LAGAARGALEKPRSAAWQGSHLEQGQAVVSAPKKEIGGALVFRLQIRHFLV
jgi:hypothetical protein